MDYDMNNGPVYWLSPLDVDDDFGDTYTNVMYDAKTKFGPWANMTERSWLRHNGTFGQLGLGKGQKYEKQPDGRWLKIEG